MISASFSDVSLEERKKSFRSSTIKQTEQIEKSQKEKTNKHKRHPKQPELRRLTQEELLAEAQITEEQNLASLAAFLKLEAEKKKTKLHKIRYQGPVIRFHSVTMPLIEELPDEPEIRVDDSHENEANRSGRKCSRNFVVFTDVNNFPKAYFPNKKVKPPEKPICVVTGMPAKYRDPITGKPYATLHAFKYIREQYKKGVFKKAEKIAVGEKEAKKKRKSTK